MEFFKKFSIIAILVLGGIGLISLCLWSYHRYAFQIYSYLYQYHDYLPGWIFPNVDASDDNKIYDAFVCFAKDDEKFLKTRLRPMLEDYEPHFKLCVHLRDWVVGSRIDDQIYKSVRNSRRTIIVLSHNFLNSDICLSEFEAARVQGIKDKTNRLIVIMLEDIAKHRLTEELQAYIATHTYIPWQDSDWFWDKLRFALRHSTHGKTRTNRRDRNQKDKNDQTQMLRRRQR